MNTGLVNKSASILGLEKSGLLLPIHFPVEKIRGSNVSPFCENTCNLTKPSAIVPVLLQKSRRCVNPFRGIEILIVPVLLEDQNPNCPSTSRRFKIPIVQFELKQWVAAAPVPAGSP